MTASQLLSIATAVSPSSFWYLTTKYTDVYQIPLIGYPTNASTAWGANIVHFRPGPLSLTWEDEVSPDNLIPITISDRESGLRMDKDSGKLKPTIIQHAARVLNVTDGLVEPDSLLIAPIPGDSEVPYINLGMQTRVVEGTPELTSTHYVDGLYPLKDGNTDIHAFNSISTTPFALHLGSSSSWNGSLVLGAKEGDTYNPGPTVAGAYYDANRVASGSWVQVKAGDGTNTILSAGVQDFGHFGVQTFKKAKEDNAVSTTNPFPKRKPDGRWKIFPTTFNFSSDAIVAPYGEALCNTDFTLTMHTNYAQANDTTPLIVPMTADLTRSRSRCYTSTDPFEDRLILGKPFLQSAYLLVSYNATEIWLTNAHQKDLPPCAAHFDPNANLTAAPLEGNACAQRVPHNAKQHSLSGGAIAGIVIGVLAGCILILAVVFFLFRKKRRDREDQARRMESSEFRGPAPRQADVKNSSIIMTANVGEFKK